jgi:hypothetical protein
MKLGKKPPRIDPRTLYLSKYTRFLPPPPQIISWTKGMADWGMLANDKLGDCTIAAVGHAVQLYTLNSWGEALVTDDEVIHYYSEWCGYNPADPSTDQGGVELDVLNHWRQNGFGMPGNPPHVLMAYADIRPDDTTNLKIAVSTFGSVYIGVSLPVTAQGQDVWDGIPTAWNPDTQPGSWGGHAVIVTGYDQGYVQFVSWGKIMTMTWRFWTHYVDEAHALLHKGWYPAGFDLETLKADLAALGTVHE